SAGQDARPAARHEHQRPRGPLVAGRSARGRSRRARPRQPALLQRRVRGGALRSGSGGLDAAIAGLREVEPLAPRADLRQGHIHVVCPSLCRACRGALASSKLCNRILLAPPITRSMTSPSLTRSTVGVARTLYCAASAGRSVTSISV